MHVLSHILSVGSLVSWFPVVVCILSIWLNDVLILSMVGRRNIKLKS